MPGPIRSGSAIPSGGLNALRSISFRRFPVVPSFRSQKPEEDMDFDAGRPDGHGNENVTVRSAGSWTRSIGALAAALDPARRTLPRKQPRPLHGLAGRARRPGLEPRCGHFSSAYSLTARGEYLSPEQAVVEGDQRITGERAHERKKPVFAGTLPVAGHTPHQVSLPVVAAVRRWSTPRSRCRPRSDAPSPPPAVLPGPAQYGARFHDCSTPCNRARYIRYCGNPSSL